MARNLCPSSILKFYIFSQRYLKAFFFFFFIWVLWPFQEYFTYIEPIIHQRWVKTGEPGEKPNGLRVSQLSYPLGYGGLLLKVVTDMQIVSVSIAKEFIKLILFKHSSRYGGKLGVFVCLFFVVVVFTSKCNLLLWIITVTIYNVNYPPNILILFSAQKYYFSNNKTVKPCLFLFFF